jgi:hypothetical protein
MSIRHLLFRNENHMVRTARRASPGFAGPVAREPSARRAPDPPKQVLDGLTHEYQIAA